MLTDKKLKALEAQERPYKVSDAEGLFVLVTPNGSRLWRLSYRFQGKQKLMALGAYPDVSLAEAREKRNDANRMRRAGKDPAHEKQAQKRRERVAAGHTFELVAQEWFETQKARWKPSYSTRIWTRIEDDLLPQLGSRPISAIEPIEVLDVVRKIEERDAVEMAKRVMQMASGIFRYGVATGRCASDPTRDLRGALRPPNPVKSRKAMPVDQLPTFFAKVRSYPGKRLITIALELTLLTLLRTQEVRFARWEEIEDLDGPEPLWRIPSERMKMERPHLVPLAPRAVTLLRDLKEITGTSPWLFPSSTKSKVISENAMIYALYRMGYHSVATVHGFRKTASTVLNEHEFNRDWVELQLAHVEQGVRRIYNAAEWLQGRRTMMCWWADYLIRAEKGHALRAVAG